VVVASFVYVENQESIAVTVLPICYLAPVPWYAAFSAAESVALEQSAHYLKQQYSNRAYIQTANGIIPLVIPVQRTGSKELLRDKKISFDTPWHKQHWRAILSAYNASPYWEFYAHYFEPLYQNPPAFLQDFLLQVHEICCKILKINSPKILTDNYLPTKYTRPPPPQPHSPTLPAGLQP
jgi:WbqC-like protein family